MAAAPPASPHPAFAALFAAVADGPLPGWDEAARAIATVAVDAGGTVFLQGVEHPCVYVVRSGLVKLSYLAGDGTEWIKSFAQEGRFFASTAALQPGGRTGFMAAALEPTVLERIDHHVLQALAERHHAWAQALYRLMLVYAARKEARERELLTLSAEARYRAFCAEQPVLARRIPQKELARHLGLTPVGLNRIAMRVRRQGG